MFNRSVEHFRYIINSAGNRAVYYKLFKRDIIRP